MFTAAKKVELPSLGEKLKKARESFSLSKEKAAQLINTQTKYIEWLENSEWNKLPVEVYMKGLLRRYAKILELNENQLIAEYDNELKITRHLAKAGAHKTLPLLRSPRFVLTPKAIVLFFGGLLFLFIIGYLAYQVGFLISPPRLEISQPQADFTTDQKEIDFIGQTEPEASLTINGQSVYLDKNGKFDQKLNLNQGLNTIKVEAVNRFGKVSSVVRQIMVK